jgi:pyruvate formate-lyase activating enzyme-like uncharacterized protein
MTNVFSGKKMEEKMDSLWKKRFLEANHAEYEEIKDQLAWISEERALAAGKERADLITAMGEGLNWMFSQTKPHTGELSPGCLLCGNGAWSCLFINGKCNCKCFYCPTSQDDISVPTTNRLSFDKAGDYSDYVRDFGFTGVSISGGEPLLTFEKTRDFIHTVRQKNGDGIHIWMYTNGTLLEEDHVLKLKDAGLSEIRFDLSAWDYNLDKLRLAVGHIPVVTVEIPAVPEDRQILERLIPVLHDEGVNHLNLHQLRLTPHNSRLLKKRGYTFLHGERVTVLEAELTALSLLNSAVSKGWKLPINYCAFAYKNQYQRAASRRRNAGFVMKPYESLTESGFIRCLSLTGDADAMTSNAAALLAEDSKKTQWQQSGSDKILFHEQLWNLMNFKGCKLGVTYSEAVVSPGLSYHNPFKEIRLGSGKKIYVEKQTRQKDIVLEGADMEVFEQAVIKGNHERKLQRECRDYEWIRAGLTEYF